MPIKKRHVLLLVMLECGCATDAQRKGENMRSVAVATAAEARQCMAIVDNDPTYNPLWTRMPKTNSDPSFAQIADTAYAQPTEIMLIGLYHDSIAKCQSHTVAQLARIDGRVGSLFEDAYLSSDQVLLAVAQKKMTWGMGNQKIQQVRVDAKRKLAFLLNELSTELNAEDAAERDRRLKLAKALLGSDGTSLPPATEGTVGTVPTQGGTIGPSPPLLLLPQPPTMTNCMSGPLFTTCMTQ